MGAKGVTHYLSYTRSWVHSPGPTKTFSYRSIFFQILWEDVLFTYREIISCLWDYLGRKCRNTDITWFLPSLLFIFTHRMTLGSQMNNFLYTNQAHFNLENLRECISNFPLQVQFIINFCIFFKLHSTYSQNQRISKL